MSNSNDIPTVQPAGGYPVARRARRPNYPPTSGLGTFVIWLARMLLVLSLVGNVVLLFLYLPISGSSRKLTTTLHSGNATANDKIALVEVKGPLMEGLM